MVLNSVEVGEMLKITNKTVANRANKIGIKKKGNHWLFNESEIEMLRNYRTPKRFQANFYFSADGEFLIVNSRMNQYQRLK
jgi:hypothetical protein